MVGAAHGGVQRGGRAEGRQVGAEAVLWAGGKGRGRGQEGRRGSALRGDSGGRRAEGRQLGAEAVLQNDRQGGGGVRGTLEVGRRGRGYEANSAEGV